MEGETTTDNTVTAEPATTQETPIPETNPYYLLLYRMSNNNDWLFLGLDKEKSKMQELANTLNNVKEKKLLELQLPL